MMAPKAGAAKAFGPPGTAATMAAMSAAVTDGKPTSRSNSRGPPGADTRFANSTAQLSPARLIRLGVPQTSLAKVVSLSMSPGEKTKLTSPGFCPLAAAVTVAAATFILLTFVEGALLTVVTKVSNVKYSVLTPIH